ncbi:MAG: EamA family transporter [Candidatus Eiseniibacteriota bacterium]
MNPAYLLAALSSVLFGAGDLGGGIASKRASAPVVACFSGFGALLGMFIALPFVGGHATSADLWWGAAAGACGSASLTLIYRSLALGPVIIASPIFCVIGLLVPVMFGVATGERPSAVAWSGVALGVVAIPLLTLRSEGDQRYSAAHIRTTVLVAALAGIGVGFFLIGLAHIGRDAGLWPLITARLVAIALFVIAFLLTRRPLIPPKGVRTLAFSVGFADAAGNFAYWRAVQLAPISLVATLVSLAPATTVLLARTFLRERWTVPQAVGLAMALVAGVLISHG